VFEAEVNLWKMKFYSIFVLIRLLLYLMGQASNQATNKAIVNKSEWVRDRRSVFSHAFYRSFTPKLNVL